MLDSYLAMGDLPIRVYYVQDDQSLARDTIARLLSALPAITDYFRLEESLPPIRAVLVPDRAEFDRLVRDLLQVSIESPSNPARIAQPQRTDLVLLSPSAYSEHSVFTYHPDDYGRLLSHELVHMVEEHLSPNMEATPRWWSEGLAVYLSQQWMYEEDFRKPATDGAREGKVPRIVEIADDRGLCYDWGWTIVRFVETVYGKDSILRVVRECSDGDVIAALGMEVGDFERRWAQCLLDNAGELGTKN